VAALALPFLWSFLRGVRLDPPSPLHKWATQASALLICGLLAWPYFRGTPVIWGLALALVLVTVRLAGRLGDLFKWFERNFVASLSPVSHESTAPARPSIMSRLAPWENELVKLVLHADSEFAGKSILSASLRNRHGINIVAIQRGSRLLVAPQPTELLLPGDEILVLAAEEALDQARPLIEQGGQLGDSGTLLEAYELRAIEVSADSPCARKTIRESGIRDRYQALVVGIEREGKRITNPDSDLTIRPGDLLWIVAESPRIDQMGQEMRQAMG
jgi:CPA2 family monovalent cation:H+ antiporter-2